MLENVSLTDEAPKKRDKNYYLEKILESIKTNGSMTRADIDKLLWDELPVELNDRQKRSQIDYFLSKLKKAKKIIKSEGFKHSFWSLHRKI